MGGGVSLRVAQWMTCYAHMRSIKRQVGSGPPGTLQESARPLASSRVAEGASPAVTPHVTAPQGTARQPAVSATERRGARCLPLLVRALLLGGGLLLVRLVDRVLVRVEDEVVARLLLLAVLGRVLLVDAWPEVARVAPEGDVELLEEDVEAVHETHGRLGRALDAGLAVVDDDTVGERGGHHEVVLNNEGGLLHVTHHPPPDDLGRDDALLAVEAGRRLVEEVDRGGGAQADGDGDALQLAARQVLDVRLLEGLHLQRAQHEQAEEAVYDDALDGLLEELLHRPRELAQPRRVVLPLVAHAQPGERVVLDALVGRAVGLLVEGARHHLHEGRLAAAVLAEQPDHLGAAEGARLDVQREARLGLLQRLGHGGVLDRAQRRLAHAALRGDLVRRLGARDDETQLLGAEAHVLRGDVAREEVVDAVAHARNLGDHAVAARLAVQAADRVRHVVEDGQVVLDDHDVLVGHAAVLLGAVEDERSDELGRGHALLDVEEGRGLVEHVAVGVAHGRRGDGEALQLAARERLDLAVDQVREVEPSSDLLPAVALVALLEHDADRPAGHRAHVVRVQLHLDGDAQIVLEHAREVLLQLRAAVVGQDLVPVGRLLRLAQVGLQLAREHVERRRLADAVGAEQAEHRAWPRRRQAVQLEGVHAVLVRHVGLQVRGQFDDLHGVAGALLGTVEARQACVLQDLDLLAIGHSDAVAAAGAGDALQEVMRRHHRLALLLIQDQHALAFDAHCRGLTVQALVRHDDGGKRRQKAR
mmetsp:Transcript_4528/g.10273  ORF Transcript_4528/g.10273 Transcript_4528/m.10273 type:complete len:761 (-) Transcript_4528:27-2309(-)